MGKQYAAEARTCSCQSPRPWRDVRTMVAFTEDIAMRGRLLLALILLTVLGPLGTPMPAGAQERATPIAEEEMAAGAFAPVPEAARGPAIPETGYLVEEIGDGLYWVTDGLYQVMFLTTGEGVILVDAPPSLGPNLATAIA